MTMTTVLYLLAITFLAKRALECIYYDY